MTRLLGKADSLSFGARMALLIGLLVLSGALAAQGIPVSGRPTPSMNAFDDYMVNYMDANSIEAALLGIMRDGDILYLKGFGWLDPDAFPAVAMPENAMVRLASVTKPVTAAATRHLVASTAGLDMNDDAFDVGQAGGGTLPTTPFNGVGDNRIDDITIEHLLRHQSGWDRDIAGDLTYRECIIAQDYGVSSPPGRTRTLDWILGEPLEFAPGSGAEYSNIGYLAAGMIVEDRSNVGLLAYVRRNILTSSMWIPWHEIRLGRTFRADGLLREPWYRADSDDNVFDDCNTTVSEPYGSWDHEARIGQGGMISTTATMLELANRYHVNVGGTIGTDRDDTEILDNGIHGGLLPGSNTSLYQRIDGVNIFVFVNKSGTNSVTDLRHAEHIRREVRDLIVAGGFAWPTGTADGFWVVPCDASCDGIYDQGGYDMPIRSLDNAEWTLGHGSKVRLKPGTFKLTDGTISTRMRIDAPLGTAVIGR